MVELDGRVRRTDGNDEGVVSSDFVQACHLTHIVLLKRSAACFATSAATYPQTHTTTVFPPYFVATTPSSIHDSQRDIDTIHQNSLHSKRLVQTWVTPIGIQSPRSAAECEDQALQHERLLSKARVH